MQSKTERIINVRAKEGWKKVSEKDIIYIEADYNCVKIHLKNNKTLIVKATIRQIYFLLSENDFIIPHRSYIVRKDKITEISKTEIRIGKILIPISQNTTII